MANTNDPRPRARRNLSQRLGIEQQTQQALIQQALDEELTPERLRELRRQLDDAPAAQAQFQHMRQVERMLRAAPMENAPENLALKIMARLAEGLQSQKLIRPNSLALAIALALFALGLTPLLAILGWLIINAVGSASALNNLLGSLFNLLATVMNTLDGLINSAQAVVQTYPEAPIAIITLIPAALLWLWRSGKPESIEE